MSIDGARHPETTGEGLVSREEGIGRDDRSQYEPHVVFSNTIWFHILFLALSFVFFFQPLAADRLLVPVSPNHWQPWAQSADRPGETAAANNPLMADSLILTVPWRVYNGKLLRGGQLPFWNPHIFCGYPHLAALQSNALHPLVAPFDLLNPVRGIAWSMAIHIALAGSLMFVFLKRLGLCQWAAFTGAVIFQFNGFFLVRMSAPSYVFTGIWTPLLLLGLLEVVRDCKWTSAWKIAIAVAMAFLGGHPQILVFMLLVGAAFFLMEVTALESGSLRRLASVAFGPAVIAATAVLIGFLLVGFQLLPFLELMGQTGRSGVDYSSYSKVTLPAFALLQGLIPDFFGHPVTNSYWFNSVATLVDPNPSSPQVWGLNYCGENLYTGFVPVVLAAIALFSDRRRHVLFFGGIVTAVFLVLLGTPVMRLFFLVFPFLRSSRPDRLIFLAILAVTVLAAFGFDALLKRGVPTGKDRRSTLIPVVLASALLWAVMWPILVSPGWTGGYGEAARIIAERLSPPAPEVVKQGVVNISLGILVPVLLLVASGKRMRRIAGLATVAAVIGPLVIFGWKFNPTQPRPLFPASEEEVAIRHLVPPGQRIARLRGGKILPSNTAQLSGLDDVNGSSAAGVGRYLNLMQTADPLSVRKDKYFKGFQSPTVAEGSFLDMLGVGLLLSQRELPEPHGNPIAPGIFAYARPMAFDRYRFVDSVESSTDADHAAARLASAEFDHEGVAMVEAGSLADEALTGSNGDIGGLSDVTVESADAHRIVLSVETSRDRLLVSSDVYYPGWVVEIDGVRSKMQLVNTAFRGAVVPAGRHVVEFRYVPRSFIVGCLVSLLGVVMMVILQLTTGRMELRDVTNSV